MIMRNLYRLVSRFSTIKQFDIVFVGPLGGRLSNEIYKTYGNRISCLNINSESEHLQPTLYPLESKPIPISSILPSKYPNKHSKISQIDPENNTLILNSNEKIIYKQLVLTQNNQPDYQRYQGLKSAVQDQSTNVFVNNTQSINNLKSISSGNLVFSIPSGRHVGQDNYQFFYVDSIIQNRLKNNQERSLKVNSILILQDGKIFKYNKDLDAYAKQLCIKNKIQILQNVKVDSINTNKRQLTLSSGIQLPYSGYYQYLPFKNNLVQGQTNPQTLTNQKYPNIFMFGQGEVPTTHCYGAKNYQLRVVKYNVIANLFGNKKRAIYNGRTIFPFWIAENKVVYFTHSYTKKLFSLGKFVPLSIFLAKMDQLMGHHEVQNYYKFRTYGYPYYICNTKIKIVDNHVNILEEIPKQYQIVRKIQV